MEKIVLQGVKKTERLERDSSWKAMCVLRKNFIVKSKNKGEGVGARRKWTLSRAVRF